MKLSKLHQCQATLLVVFLLGFVVQLAGLFWIRREMRSADLQDLTLKLLGIYGVHIAVMTGGIFAQKKGRTQPCPLFPFWLALSLSLLWNLLLVWFTMAFINSEGEVKGFADQIVAVSQASSFLVAGALAYFFAKGASE